MDNWLAIDSKHNDPIFNKHFALQCPHCGVHSNLSALSVPDWDHLKRYIPEHVVIGYRCDACNEPVALRFKVFFDVGNYRATFSGSYEELERALVTFEYQHLPSAVADDFREALTCYSHGCHNGAAAMCRRTIQSVATDLGTTGSSRVEKQILEAKEAADMDDDTYDSLKTIMLGGHDGAHPHLPKVSPERAGILIEMMMDVLTQIYVRRNRIRTAMQLRDAEIAAKKSENSS